MELSVRGLEQHSVNRPAEVEYTNKRLQTVGKHNQDGVSKKKTTGGYSALKKVFTTLELIHLQSFLQPQTLEY